jgi:hypothetical protein
LYGYIGHERLLVFDPTVCIELRSEEKVVTIIGIQSRVQSPNSDLMARQGFWRVGSIKQKNFKSKSRSFSINDCVLVGDPRRHMVRDHSHGFDMEFGSNF